MNSDDLLRRIKEKIDDDLFILCVECMYIRHGKYPDLEHTPTIIPLYELMRLYYGESMTIDFLINEVGKAAIESISLSGLLFRIIKPILRRHHNG